MKKELLEEIMQGLEHELSQMLEQQRERAITVARSIRPNLTREDLLNPDDYPEIVSDSRFAYEDGQTAGILSAKIAVRSLLKNKR